MKESRRYNSVKKKTKNQLATIGQRIKDVRAVLRYSQRSMASDLEMSSSYLSEIESGKANPGPDFFLKLADKFDISVEYLFHGRGAMFYGNDRIVGFKEYNFDEELDSIEKLGWLMNHSKLFKNTVLGFSSRFLLNNEGIIKKSIEKSRKAQKEGQPNEK